MKSVFFVRTEDRRPLFVVTTSEKSTDFQPLSDEAYVLMRTLNEVFTDVKVSEAQLIAALPEKSNVEGPFNESDKTAKRIASFLEQAGIPDYLPSTRAPKITGRSTYSIEIADAPLTTLQNRKSLQDLVQFKASAFINEQTKSTFNYEVKRVRAVWDDSLSIPGTGRRGGWRCPPGARFGGQITDRFGRNCGWGIARRLANAITNVGERLDSPSLAEGGRRLEDADVARRGNRMARRNARMARRLAREGTEAETLTGRAQRMRERVGRVFGSGDDAMFRTGPVRFPRRQRQPQQQPGGQRRRLGSGRVPGANRRPTNGRRRNDDQRPITDAEIEFAQSQGLMPRDGETMDQFIDRMYNDYVERSRAAQERGMGNPVILGREAWEQRYGTELRRTAQAYIDAKNKRDASSRRRPDGSRPSSPRRPAGTPSTPGSLGVSPDSSRRPTRNPDAGKPGQPDWIQPTGPKFRRIGDGGVAVQSDDDGNWWVWQPGDGSDRPSQWIPFNEVPSSERPTDRRETDTTPEERMPDAEIPEAPAAEPEAETPRPKYSEVLPDETYEEYVAREYRRLYGSDAVSTFQYLSRREPIDREYRRQMAEREARGETETTPETPEIPEAPARGSREYSDLLPNETLEEYLQREYARIYGDNDRGNKNRIEPIARAYWEKKREQERREREGGQAETPATDTPAIGQGENRDREAPGRRVSSATQRMHEARQKYEQEQGRIDDFFRRPESRDILPINGGLSDEDRESLGLPRVGEQPFEFLMRRWLDDRERTGSDMSFDDWLDADADGMSRRDRELTRFASANGRPNRTQRPALGPGNQGSDSGAPERRPETLVSPIPPQATPRTDQPVATEPGKRWRDVVDFNEFVDEKYQEYEDRVDAARSRGDNIDLATREEWLSVNAERLARDFDGPAPEDRLPRPDQQGGQGGGARRRRTGGSQARARETASRTPRASDIPEGQAAPQERPRGGRPNQMSGRTVAALDEAGIDVDASRREAEQRYRMPSPGEWQRLRDDARQMLDDDLNSDATTRIIEDERRITQEANDALSALEEAVRDGRTEDYDRLTREWSAARAAANPEMGIGLLEAERERRAQRVAETAAIDERNQEIRRNAPARARMALEAEREELQRAVDEASANAEQLAAERSDIARRLRQAEDERNRLLRLKDEAARLAEDARNKVRRGEIEQADADAAQAALYDGINALSDAFALVQEIERERNALDERMNNIRADEVRLAEIDAELRNLPGGETPRITGAPTRSVRSQVTPPEPAGTGRPQGRSRSTLRTQVEGTPVEAERPERIVTPEVPEVPEAPEQSVETDVVEAPESPNADTVDAQEGFVPRRKMNKLADRHDPENGLYPLSSPDAEPYVPVPDGPAPLTDDELRTRPLSEVPDSQLGDALDSRAEPAWGNAFKQWAISQGMPDPDTVAVNLVTELEDHIMIPGAQPFSPELSSALQQIRASGKVFLQKSGWTAASPSIYYFITPEGTLDGRGFIAKRPDSYFGDAQSHHAELFASGLAKAWGFATVEPRMSTLDGSPNLARKPVVILPFGQNLADGLLETRGSGGYGGGIDDKWGNGPYSAGKTLEDADSRLGHALINGIIGAADRHSDNGMIFAGNGALPIDFGRAFLYEVNSPYDLIRVIEHELMNRNSTGRGSRPLDENPMGTYKYIYDEAIANGSDPQEALDMVRERLRQALDDWADATQEFLDGPAPGRIESLIDSAIPNPSYPVHETVAISDRAQEIRDRIEILRGDEIIDLLLEMMTGGHLGSVDDTRVVLIDGRSER